MSLQRKRPSAAADSWMRPSPAPSLMRHLASWFSSLEARKRPSMPPAQCFLCSVATFYTWARLVAAL